MCAMCGKLVHPIDCFLPCDVRQGLVVNINVTDVLACISYGRTLGALLKVILIIV